MSVTVTAKTTSKSPKSASQANALCIVSSNAAR